MTFFIFEFQKGTKAIRRTCVLGLGVRWGEQEGKAPALSVLTEYQTFFPPKTCMHACIHPPVEGASTTQHSTAPAQHQHSTNPTHALEFVTSSHHITDFKPSTASLPKCLCKVSVPQHHQHQHHNTPTKPSPHHLDSLVRSANPAVIPRCRYSTSTYSTEGSPSLRFLLRSPVIPPPPPPRFIHHWLVGGFAGGYESCPPHEMDLSHKAAETQTRSWICQPPS